VIASDRLEEFCGISNSGPAVLQFLIHKFQSALGLLQIRNVVGVFGTMVGVTDIRLRSSPQQNVDSATVRYLRNGMMMTRVKNLESGAG
jgi:hypothetical protein